MNFKLTKSSLNFKVYTSPTIPSSGAENDIVIISSTPMENWVLSPDIPIEEPRNNGDIWIEYSVSGNVFDIMNQHDFMLAITKVYQYVGKTWMSVNARRYVGGVWDVVSSAFSASINITYPANSTCVVTNSNGQTVASNSNTGTSTKTWTATVNATGTYTVTATATDGSGKSKSQSVSITADGQSVSVELSYGFYIFKEGEGLLNGYTVERFQRDTASEYSFNNNRILWADNNAVGNILTFLPKTDCTTYKKVGFEFKCKNRYDSNYSVTIGVGSDKPSGENKPGTFVASVSDIYSTERKKYFVDLSNVNTLNYVKFAAFAVTGEIYNVWFE